MEHDVQSSMGTCVCMYDRFALNYKCLPSCTCVWDQLLETLSEGMDTLNGNEMVNSLLVLPVRLPPSWVI